MPDEYSDAEGGDSIMEGMVMDANDDVEEPQPEKPAKKEGRRLGWIRGKEGKKRRGVRRETP